MNTKKALAGLLLSLSLAGGIVASASAALAIDETTAVAPAAGVVTETPVVVETPATETAVLESTPIVLVYVEIYQNEKLLLQGLKPIRVEQGEDLVAVALSRGGGLTGEYGIFLRGEIEYLNEGAAVVKLYFFYCSNNNHRGNNNDCKSRANNHNRHHRANNHRSTDHRSADD